MNSKRKKITTQHSEEGYALIAIVGILMFALILTTAAAPMIKRESQREKEEEMLWRGDQMQRAIARYVTESGGGRYPTNLKKDLVDGIKNAAGKQVRFLRASALCDPLKPCNEDTNWRLVHQGDSEPKELREAILDYLAKENAGIKPLTTGAPLLEQEAMRFVGKLPGSSSDSQSDKDSDKDSDSGDKLKGKPIVGVTSGSTGKMFRSYYGIEEYENALFFPSVQVVTGGIIPPKGISAAFVPGGAGVARCPDGGPMVLGRCNYGRLNPGQLCRGPNGESIPCPGR